jgi:hypothetical protein
MSSGVVGSRRNLLGPTRDTHLISSQPIVLRGIVCRGVCIWDSVSRHGLA